MGGWTVRIAIIGAGSVGGTLAIGWSGCGHQVRLGVRNPADPKVQALLGKFATPGVALPLAEAVADAPVVVLATPWDATLEVVRGLSLAGKVVIDTTNPLLPNLAGLGVGGATSGAEEIARAAPGARVVKCFNTTGANNFLAPDYPEGAATMLYAGTTRRPRRRWRRWAGSWALACSTRGRWRGPGCSSRSRCCGSRWPTRRGRGGRSPGG